MAQLMEYAEYLSKGIGPRPAGTEEEQQASLYITEQFQKGSGFTAEIEEFTSTSNLEGASAIPGIVVIIVAILAMALPILSIPAFILAVIAAAVYVLEAFGNPIVSRLLARGASQNVVAKYNPGSQKRPVRGRRRKIVLVAHYDSGKVTPGLVKRVEALPVPIELVCVCGMVLAAFFLLLHIFVNSGAGAVVINVLTVIALIICAYPVLKAVLMRRAPYNEGANNNASGTAALLEVARRISRGSVSEADLAANPEAYDITVHGEEAACEQGLVPEGAQIRYESEQLVPPAEIGAYTAEDRLLSAKAAIAAMTGQPVERKTFGSVASHLVNSRATATMPAAVDAAASKPTVADAAFEEAKEIPETFEAPVVEEGLVEAKFQEETAVPVGETRQGAFGYENAPSWFVAAQSNAKKVAGEINPGQRSRFTTAIETAERERSEREAARAEQERAAREAELKAREEATRAAIAANAVEQAPAEPESTTEERMEEAAGKTLSFTPYSEERFEEMTAQEPAKQEPARQAPTRQAHDELAASLGATTAFNPLAHQGDEPLEEEAQPRLRNLPSIDKAPVNDVPSRSGLFRRLRADVPSLSGVIRMQEAGEDVSQKPEERKPSPRLQEVPAVEEDEVNYDMELDGYEDSQTRASGDYEQPYEHDHDEAPTESTRRQRSREDKSAEVPTSRAGRFFNRFRRKKDDALAAETPQQWLDVEDDFDARTVGRARGGWESFREEEQADDTRRPRRNGNWEGGAFSRARLGRVNTRSGEEDKQEDKQNPEAVQEPIAAEPLLTEEEDRQIIEEIENIYHFRNPLYNTEIWFVALGAEESNHDGIKAFMSTHADDLRGAMVIEVESLGFGELCVASDEGALRTISASSRVKRYTRSATAATGIVPGSVSLAGSDSAASILQAAGYQAMHLLGVENGQPALKGDADDIMENIDDLLFDDNVNFIMELLKK